jgi:cytoskeletal protein RodZ
MDEDLQAPERDERVRRGKNFRRARERRGIDPGTLAGQLNLRTSFILAVEEGIGDTHMPWAYERIHHKSIALALGVDPEV